MSITKVFIGGMDAYLNYAIYARDKRRNQGKLIAISLFDRSNATIRSLMANINLGFGPKNLCTTTGVHRPYVMGKGGYNCYFSRVDLGHDQFVEGIGVLKEVGKKVFLSTKERYDTDLYNFLMENYELPLKAEWMPYLSGVLQESGKMQVFDDCVVRGREAQDGDELFIDGLGKDAEVVAAVFYGLQNEELSSFVTSGIEAGKICVTQTKQKEMQFEDMDSYFAEYGPAIIKNLQEKVKPLVDTTGTIENVTLRNKRLFCKQADAVKGIAACLDQGGSSYCIVNEGMGCGKTLQGAAAVEAYYVGKYLKGHPGTTLKEVYEHPEWINYRVIIMCPGHLVEKWGEEVRKEVPYARAVILREFSQLVGIKARGNKRKGREFYVMSMDFAKLGYTEAPVPTKVRTRAVQWHVCSECGKKKVGYGKQTCTCGNDTFKLVPAGYYDTGLICPECDNLLMPDIDKLQVKQDAENPTEPLLPHHLSSHTTKNSVCYYCGEKIWSPLVKNIGTQKESKWRRVGHYANAARKGKTSAWVLEGFEQSYVDYKAGPGCKGVEELTPGRTIGIRKYPPSQYIKKQLKSFFDFAILDEAHKYKSGGSAQGQAADALIKSAKKTLALTGTIAGGKASDLFYLFFRLDPQRMLSFGYQYTDVSKFSRKYGCVETSYRANGSGDGDEFNATSRGRKLSEERTKPGISLLVFTKFMLDRTVFLDLTDMSSQLPPLKEVIVPVELEEDVRAAYTQTISKLRSAREKESLLGAKLQFSLSYTDKPYGIPPILSPKTGIAVAAPSDLRHYETELLNKEKKLVEIVRKEIEEGRSIFVYNEYTGDSPANITYRLKNVLEREIPEIKGQVCVMESTSPKADERETFIHEEATKGMRVFICNPRLVETGLDFCFDENGVNYSYATIIFFQMGYSLFTLWQASCRHYRLNQTQECRTYYMYSKDTLQLDVIRLMALKKNSVSVLQGRGFSSEGLASMSQGVDAQQALAKALIRGCEENADEEVAAMFDSYNKQREEEYQGDIVSMPLFEELVGKPCAIISDEAEELGLDDAMDMFSLIGGVAEVQHKEIVAEHAMVKKQVEDILDMPMDIATFTEVLFESFTVTEKTTSKKCLKGQISMLDLLS